jgi:hypothetical protein
MSYRISSNLTMLLKIILPSLWAVFFGSFALAFFIADPADTPVLYNPLFKWSFLGVFLFFLLIIYFTIGRLVRVEMDEEYIYVSNYFKTYRYPIQNLKDIKEDDLILFKLIRFEMVEKSRFGRRIPFLAARTRLNTFIEEHPEIFERFAS